MLKLWALKLPAPKSWCCSLWKERDHVKLVLQDHRWKVFPSQSPHSALYPLKAVGGFSTVTKGGRKDRDGRGFVHL